MPVVKILCDSTCDLPAEWLKEHGVQVLPLHIVLGHDEYEDGRGITPDEIFRWSDANNQTPKTAACTVEQAMEAFEPYALEGDGAVCFAISQSMSSAVNNMRIAAQKLEAQDRIHIIDSASLSTGIGLLIMEAVEMAQQGMCALDIAKAIEAVKPLVHASFVVDTLTFLHRGGRCSGVAAFVGSTLKLHPMITVENGSMVAGKKYRGRMRRVVLDYVEDLMPGLRHAKTDCAFIVHSGCEHTLLNEVKAKLLALDRFEQIIVTQAGGVISSHCGPGAIGVMFVAGA